MRFARLEDLRGAHRGEDIVVCGCGRSLATLPAPERYVTIGVNDVGRRFTPDYLVVLNPPSSFAGDRWAHIRRTNPRYFLSQYRLEVTAQTYVQFRLGRFGGVDFADPGALNYTQNSPYVAIDLAVRLGARRIGLAGVDFTDDHFFGRTGRHPLQSRLAEIDAQFARLDAACRAAGVDVVNLSAESRLTAFRKGRLAELRPRADRAAGAPRIFVVTYTFQTAGDVFGDGLARAAGELDVVHDQADWSDPGLPDKVRRFAPDLLFVVHGRMFARRWGAAFTRYRTAVWLLDEPYEVDDTSRYSAGFDHVFVNDPSTLPRHPRATYLPVAYDPALCFDPGAPRGHRVGFVGGSSPAREAALDRLEAEGLLSYVVGGPWRSPRLARRALAERMTPAQTAELYRRTQIVVNVFRDRHHWNRAGIPAQALNPRIYEALAAGALVVSERRREIEERLPELPVFGDPDELVKVVRRYLERPEELEQDRTACRERLAGETFARRLRTVLDTTLGAPMEPLSVLDHSAVVPDAPEEPRLAPPAGLPDGWEADGRVVTVADDGTLVLRTEWDPTPGSERGLASTKAYDDLDLAFDVHVGARACFVAKIHQAGRVDQRTNSYHLMWEPTGLAYLAKHHHVFKRVALAREAWERIRLVYRSGLLECHRNEELLFRLPHRELPRGFAVLAVKGGEVRLRNVTLSEPRESAPPGGDEAIRLRDFTTRFDPRVSIVTTVYDRVECLRRCLRSVKKLLYRDYEQIVVADAPPPDVLAALTAVVEQEDDGRVCFLTLGRRVNNWGIAPAAAGLARARGAYLCFLSDDNGYTPDHLDHLVRALDGDPGLGFAYSSCRYDGRMLLTSPVPRPGGIDLGQPIFRRELFSRYLNDGLPFGVAAWDWQLVETFMRNRVRWKHVNRPTFLFRLAKYRQFAG